jgi:hypothetical protein
MLAVAISVAALAAGASERRGAVAFHYATPLTPSQLAWYSRFDVLVTHGRLPPAQVAQLHARGTKLVLYEWAVAFYGSLAAPWQKQWIADRRGLLHLYPLRGGVGAPDADAWYYDPASREHVEERPRLLAQKLRAIGYDGVFLDTTTAESVHAGALEEYRLRHPDLDYNAAFARFMKNLRRELGAKGIIISNQGYRAADSLLPWVDYDVSESLISHPVSGKYVMRPRKDAHDPWKGIDFLMRKLIAPAKEKYPRVRFIHLNYVDALSPKAVEGIVRIARMHGDEAFVTLPSLAREGSDDDAYFRAIPLHRGSARRVPVP